MADYDAFLLVSFGGPEGPDDVMPFLQNVTRGRGIPPERLEAVARHYDAVGGVSPINQQCRDLITAIGKDFAAAGVDLPIYWGNRNWDPYLTETVAEMRTAGVRRALAFVTSAYGSYSSCRQYLDDIERARAEAGPDAPQIDKIRHFFSHPGFTEPFADATRRAIASLPPGAPQDRPPRVHGAQRPGGHGGGQRAAARRPLPGAAGRGGQAHRGTHQRTGGPSRGGPGRGGPGGGLGPAGLAPGGGHPWRLVYQSRSGPPSQPWLGPDVCDYLEELARGGAPGAVLVPVGFTSDHMEVVHDLDVNAAGVARRLGLPLARAATPGTNPRFVSMITALVSERRGSPLPGAALGSPGCGSADCCRPPAPGGRPGRPAAAS